MPGFWTDADIQAAAAAITRPGVTTPNPAWLSLAVTDANLRAWDALLSAFTPRGLTAAQILQWPAGASYQREIALFLVSVRARMDLDSEQGGTAFLELSDPRDELATANPTDATGLPILPLPVTAPTGPVGFGYPKDNFGRALRGDRMIDRCTGRLRKF